MFLPINFSKNFIKYLCVRNQESIWLISVAGTPGLSPAVNSSSFGPSGPQFCSHRDLIISPNSLTCTVKCFVPSMMCIYCLWNYTYPAGS